jgi:hypothetical protein
VGQGRTVLGLGKKERKKKRVVNYYFHHFKAIRKKDLPSFLHFLFARLGNFVDSAKVWRMTNKLFDDFPLLLSLDNKSPLGQWQSSFFALGSAQVLRLKLVPLD